MYDLFYRRSLSIRTTLLGGIQVGQITQIHAVKAEQRLRAGAAEVRHHQLCGVSHDFEHSPSPSTMVLRYMLHRDSPCSCAIVDWQLFGMPTPAARVRQHHGMFTGASATGVRYIPDSKVLIGGIDGKYY